MCLGNPSVAHAAKLKPKSVPRPSRHKVNRRRWVSSGDVVPESTQVPAEPVEFPLSVFSAR